MYKHKMPWLVGENNYQVKRLRAIYGDYLPTTDPFVMQARGILYRCKKFNIPTDFDSGLELGLYLKQITPQKCPVFNKRLTRGAGQPHRFSPSVDRINPHKGYVKGNMQVISMFANHIKQEATKHQLKKFATWIVRGQNATVR